MTVPPLTFRLDKGSPLTSEEHDENLKLIRDFCDGLAKLFEIVFNADGTLKNSAVVTTSIADRAVTQRKLDWLANFYSTASGVDNYIATINPVTGFGYGDGATTSFFCIIKFTNANTGAATLDMNAGGAKPIKKLLGDALVAGEILAGSIHLLAYDGTNFQLLTVVPTVAPRGIPTFLDPVENVFNDTTAPDWTRFDSAVVPVTASAFILSCSWQVDGATPGAVPSILIRADSGSPQLTFVTSSAIDGDDSNTNQGMFPVAVDGGVPGFDFKVIQGFPQGCVIDVIGYIS